MCTFCRPYVGMCIWLAVYVVVVMIIWLTVEGIIACTLILGKGPIIGWGRTLRFPSPMFEIFWG